MDEGSEATYPLCECGHRWAFHGGYTHEDGSCSMYKCECPSYTEPEQ